MTVDKADRFQYCGGYADDLVHHRYQRYELTVDPKVAEPLSHLFAIRYGIQNLLSWRNGELFGYFDALPADLYGGAAWRFCACRVFYDKAKIRKI